MLFMRPGRAHFLSFISMFVFAFIFSLVINKQFNGVPIHVFVILILNFLNYLFFIIIGRTALRKGFGITQIILLALFLLFYCSASKNSADLDMSNIYKSMTISLPICIAFTSIIVLGFLGPLLPIFTYCFITIFINLISIGFAFIFANAYCKNGSYFYLTWLPFLITFAPLALGTYLYIWNETGGLSFNTDYDVVYKSEVRNHYEKPSSDSEVYLENGTKLKHKKDEEYVDERGDSWFYDEYSDKYYKGEK